MRADVRGPAVCFDGLVRPPFVCLACATDMRCDNDVSRRAGFEVGCCAGAVVYDQGLQGTRTRSGTLSTDRQAVTQRVLKKTRMNGEIEGESARSGMGFPKKLEGKRAWRKNELRLSWEAKALTLRPGVADDHRAANPTSHSLSFLLPSSFFLLLCFIRKQRRQRGGDVGDGLACQSPVVVNVPCELRGATLIPVSAPRACISQRVFTELILEQPGSAPTDAPIFFAPDQ